MKASETKGLLLKELESRGEHAAAAMIGLGLMAVAEQLQGLVPAIQRHTDELARQWGYDKPRIR